MNPLINADFSQTVIIHSHNQPWQSSPMPGVLRRPLDRVGGEIARATSIVQYAENSHFSAHTHTGGEEFLVLAGTFQDEHGDYPAGTYIRNPPHSIHMPYSQQGCRIFVKLWQFDPDDTTTVRCHYQDLPAQHDDQLITTTLLYKDDFEQVSIQAWPANITHTISAPKGLEILVLSGELTVNDQSLQQESWLRLPCNSTLTATAGSQGVTFWIKQHHLTQVDKQVRRVKTALT